MNKNQNAKNSKENDRMKKDELVKHNAPNGNASALAVPDYLQRPAGTVAAGLEQVEQSDMTLPRLALCQSMSPQRKKSDPKYIEGLDEGQFFNTITRTVFGTTVQVVPLLFFKSRVRFGAMDEGGGVLCRADDNLTGIGDPGGVCAVCPMAQFRNDESPECNQFYNYAVLVIDSNGRINISSLAVFSLKSTGLKFARDWNALMKLRNTDAFAGVYELTGMEQKKDAYSWHVPTIKPAGWVSKENYEFARDAYNSVREFFVAGRLRVHMEDDREPGSDG